MRAADSEFDRATALTASPVAGERAAHLDDQWRIGNGINGGNGTADAGGRGLSVDRVRRAPDDQRGSCALSVILGSNLVIFARAFRLSR